jgi:hypothetical protein
LTGDASCKRGELPYRRGVTGKFSKITLSIDRPRLTPEDIKKLQEAQRAKAISD